MPRKTQNNNGCHNLAHGYNQLSTYPITRIQRTPLTMASKRRVSRYSNTSSRTCNTSRR
ncbi:hypothetical protein Hanom_Chr04g00324961 [Helianthus anomalus]